MARGESRRQFVWSSVLLVAVIGLIGTDVAVNRPRLYTADPATGRVWRAPAMERHPPHFTYYTTLGGYTVAWSFAVLMGVAILALSRDRF